MIPDIMTIVKDLTLGIVTEAQAIVWLHQHIENAHAEQSDGELRDYFAGHAMQGLMARIGAHEAHLVAHDAYLVGDAMMAARLKRKGD